MRGIANSAGVSVFVAGDALGQGEDTLALVDAIVVADGFGGDFIGSALAIGIGADADSGAGAGATTIALGGGAARVMSYTSSGHIADSFGAVAIATSHSTITGISYHGGGSERGASGTVDEADDRARDNRDFGDWGRGGGARDDEGGDAMAQADADALAFAHHSSSGSSTEATAIAGELSAGSGYAFAAIDVFIA